MIDRVKNFLFRPMSSANLSAYRILFGLLNAAGLLRFWHLGWIERCFTEPSYLFKYYGFGWVQLWPGNGIYIHFALLIGICFCLSLGLLTRTMSILFFLGFTYIELLDSSNYLNHYYLITLLGFINIFLPLGARWSLDNWLGLSQRLDQVSAWTLYWLRGQIATVYFFAGLAKFGSDWLLKAQPLNIWLTSNSSLPFIGPWLADQHVHYAMSWGGFLFDMSIPFWMMWSRTRPYAYLVILFFHAMTYLLFPIGMFPLIMVTSALVFFAPEWPLKFLPKTNSKATPLRWSGAPSGWIMAGLCLYFLIQWSLPFRHFLYPGNVLWTEEGMRFSWKVMIREKNSDIEFRVRDRKSGRVWEVSPSQYLARHQENEMSGTPDMIVQFAHFLRDEFKKDGLDVAVYADTMSSFNGRSAAPLIKASVDLTQEEDSLWPKKWILPAPQTLPHTLTAKRP